ncbi:hypothetical protein HMPREF1544_00207 [Mucor circinelloides 1006PhL]|uniref:Uncharacterized protein n=1 Tax=Mucor circinelloides f. circinelloides (strain 1006PhL) TaxID=1220926 RepID=S2KC93_MUCC1|nr:hypothetical protein HMPREF1544_00207 [Mucor circinelloides 1006PhL]
MPRTNARYFQRTACNLPLCTKGFKSLRLSVVKIGLHAFRTIKPQRICLHLQKS